MFRLVGHFFVLFSALVNWPYVGGSHTTSPHTTSAAGAGSLDPPTLAALCKAMPNASNAECKPDSVSCQDNSVPDASNVAANGESRPLKPQPCIFVNHGGGPMPLLNSPDQKEITQFLKTTARSIIKKAAPRAILIVSAHWETAGAVHVSSMERPDMIFDYYGFPAEVCNCSSRLCWLSFGTSFDSQHSLTLAVRSVRRPTNTSTPRQAATQSWWLESWNA